MTDYKNKKIWVVAGVEDQAKDKAKELAKLDKKKLGPWITELISNRNPQSFLDIAGQLDSSKDVIKIMNYLEKIHVLIHDINIQLSTISYKIHPLEKKSFLDKFFK